MGSRLSQTCFPLQKYFPFSHRTNEVVRPVLLPHGAQHHTPRPDMLAVGCHSCQETSSHFSCHRQLENTTEKTPSFHHFWAKREFRLQRHLGPKSSVHCLKTNMWAPPAERNLRCHALNVPERRRRETPPLFVLKRTGRTLAVTGLFSISCRLRPTCRAHAHACRSLQLSTGSASSRPTRTFNGQVVNMR